VAYLCAVVDDYFAQEVSPRDVVWTWAGVRALVDDGASEAREATRDYVLHLDAPPGAAAALSVYGGKITTYRRLAEAALKRLKPHLPGTLTGPWTAAAPLPGGDFPRTGLERLIEEVRERHPFLAPPHARRLVRSYGTRALSILKDADAEGDLGQVFCGDLSAREVDYLMDQEWARTAQDVLVRRSKLNLLATEGDARRLTAYMQARRGEGAPLARAAAPERLKTAT
jgi:glycerol-3-phosphate dehydrogenase